MEMHVSVVVVAYKTAEYISQCLDSILRQKGLNLEIICINDCSTDNIGDILEKYRHKYPKNIKVITHPINMGYGYSMNIGIEAATAPITCCVDSDDFLIENSLYNICKQLKDTNADFIQMKQCIYKDDLYGSEVRDFSNIVDTSIRKDNQFTTPIFPWSKVYKTSFVKNFKFTESPGASYQDVSFGGNVSFYASTIGMYKELVYVYRYNRSGNSCHVLSRISRSVYIRYEYTKFLHQAYESGAADMVKAINYVVNGLKYHIEAYNILSAPMNPVLIDLLQDVFSNYKHIIESNEALQYNLIALYNQITLKK